MFKKFTLQYYHIEDIFISYSPNINWQLLNFEKTLFPLKPRYEYCFKNVSLNTCCMIRLTVPDIFLSDNLANCFIYNIKC